MDGPKDMVLKRRVQRHNAAKSHCPKGHPYSGENLYVYENGARDCKACRRDRQRAYRKKKKTG